MLSIAKLRAGGEGYYLDQVVGPEEYYLGAGEAPGAWLGSASGALGLVGEVQREELSAVLASTSPVDGAPLTGRAVSPDRHVPGFDLTFSAPKSVSLLYGLASPEVSEAVRLSHDEAVCDALAYLEAHAAFTRRGADGVRRIGTSGFVAAGFRHRTSRSNDPQLHTHVLVANVVRGNDGRWSSLHASAVYHQSRTAGFVYQAALRSGMVSRLGVRFEPAMNGMAEIAGIPPEFLKAFSTRRAEIEAQLATVGASSARAAQIAAVNTRQPKGRYGGAGEPLPTVGLREGWREESRSAGFDPDLLGSALGRPRRPMLSADRLAVIADVILGPEGLTHHASTFEHRDVVRSLAEQLADGARLPAIEAGADTVMADERVVLLGTEGRSGEEKATTAELLAIEAELLAVADAGSAAGAGLVDPTVVDRVLEERSSIAPEQAAMVRQLTSSGAGVEVVVGKAGAGKTYALDAARAAWQAGGYRVQGAALAARAAAELESGAGIASTTLARLFASIDRGDVVLGRRDVIVVDEAGMVGSRALHRLVTCVARAGGKLVAVGDPRQLPEIEAGGGLGALARRLGAVELAENRRQDAAWEREALDELRHGEVSASVVAYGEHGRLHEHDSAASARRAMVSQWAAARSDGAGARMYALRRSDVEDLNALARLELRRRGELGADVLSAGERSYTCGDEVLFCRNDRELKVLNGTRGTVLLAEGDVLVVETDRGVTSVPAAYLDAGYLAHGYASTVHKAQGATVERAFVLGGDALYREAGYVALSRATAGTDLFVVTSAFEDGRGSDVPNDGVIAGLARALSASRAKELAVDQLAPGRRDAIQRVDNDPTEASGTGDAPAKTPPANAAGRLQADVAPNDVTGDRPPTAGSDRWAWTDRLFADVDRRRGDNQRPMASATQPDPRGRWHDVPAGLGNPAGSLDVTAPTKLEAESPVDAPATGADRLAWLALMDASTGCVLDDGQQTPVPKTKVAGLDRDHGPERSSGRGR